MELIRKIMQNRLGRYIATGACVIPVVILVFAISQFFGQSSAAAESRNRVFVCSETGKTFRTKIDVGTAIPVYSPFSGKNTGYLAELCYWNKDGSIKSEPTGVLLNERMGKPGPTFCPDCDRLVVGHNPQALAGMTPPPTREEYEKASRARSPSF